MPACPPGRRRFIDADVSTTNTKIMAGVGGARRLAAGLAAMTPADAQLPMKPEAAHEELTCNSCHPAHRFELPQAAVEACLGCHDDEHFRAKAWLFNSDADQQILGHRLVGLPINISHVRLGPLDDMIVLSKTLTAAEVSFSIRFVQSCDCVDSLLLE